MSSSPSMLEPIFRLPSQTAEQHRIMAHDAIAAALAAGTFRLSEVLVVAQPARNRAMEVLTENYQTRSTSHHNPTGMLSDLRILVRVGVPENGRTPKIGVSKHTFIDGRGQQREGEKRMRAYPPGVHMLSLKHAISALLKYGRGVVDARRLSHGRHWACMTEIGYEYQGQRFTTEHLIPKPAEEIAERLEETATPLPEPGAQQALPEKRTR